MTQWRLLFLIITATILPSVAYSQYILNGSATKESCNCYILTQPIETQGGSVWQATKIDLNESFDFVFNVYLGDKDFEGADGIAFILQPLSTSLGATGGGMGFEGVKPSIGIVLDTYQNTENNDPSEDHISIQANGVITHGNDLAGPVPVSSTNNNIEDGQWHTLRISWNPATFTLSTSFDGVFRLSSTTDLVKDIFNGNSMVYWGFSGATGGKVNLQKFCTALNPSFIPSSENVCFGTPVSFSENSTSFTQIKNFSWDFGDNTFSTSINPPIHQYKAPGVYQAKLEITGADGCQSTYTKAISIGDFPVVSLALPDVCEKSTPELALNIALQVGTINKWDWMLNGTAFSTLPVPDFTSLIPGNYTIDLKATSNIGCESAIKSTQFSVKNVPDIDLTLKDGCINIPNEFSGLQTDKKTTIDKWNWTFEPNHSLEGKDVSYAYKDEGTYPIQLIANANNGCSTTISKTITINSVTAVAGEDILVSENEFFQLNGSGGTFYSWSPATGLSNPNIANPMGNATDDTRYVLTVKSTEGCSDTSSLKVTVFKGSAIYVPNAFTPNGDGKNENLNPRYIGIKSLTYFRIYDRWGKNIFNTTDMTKGWDGYISGQPAAVGGYVWGLDAVDLMGKKYHLRGNIALIR